MGIDLEPTPVKDNTEYKGLVMFVYINLVKWIKRVSYHIDHDNIWWTVLTGKRINKNTNSESEFL